MAHILSFITDLTASPSITSINNMQSSQSIQSIRNIHNLHPSSPSPARYLDPFPNPIHTPDTHTRTPIDAIPALALLVNVILTWMLRLLDSTCQDSKRSQTRMCIWTSTRIPGRRRLLRLMPKPVRLPVSMGLNHLGLGVAHVLHSLVRGCELEQAEPHSIAGT